MTSATLHRWTDIENEQLNPLLSRKYITGSQAMLAHFDLRKGCTIPTHSHPNEQISSIVQGSLRFVLGDGDVRIVNAGEVLVIPPNLPHSADALEDTTAFDIFTPPRQDWIDKTDTYLR